jgi:SlyX protein
MAWEFLYTMSLQVSTIQFDFIMENNTKKFEEITSFIQKELSQLSDEVFNQQNEITSLKSEIAKLKKRIAELQEELETNIDKENQIPPHY